MWKKKNLGRKRSGRSERREAGREKNDPERPILGTWPITKSRVLSIRIHDPVDGFAQGGSMSPRRELGKSSGHVRNR